MKALFSILRSRIGWRQRKHTLVESSVDIIEPSVEVTSVAIADDRNHNDETEENPGERAPFLYTLARRWAWQAVAYRCEMFPHEAQAQYRDQFGDSLMHWTCFGSPPAAVVESLLQACPELAKARNDKGCLPLHVACSYRASGAVIRALVQCYPEGAGLADEAGSYPLHILCDYGCSVESIRALVETAEGAMSTIKRDGIFCRTPLQILNERKNFNEFHESLEKLRNSRSRQQVSPENYEEGDANLVCDGLNILIDRLNGMAFWQKSRLLVLAEFHGKALTSDDMMKGAGVLHAIATLPSCPPSLLEFAVLLNAEELLTEDCHGELPLHTALMAADETAISDVLGAQPKAARFPDRDGRLPLQIFVRKYPKAGWSGVLDQLISAYPVAMEALDLDKRLYPLVWSRMIAKKDMNSLFEIIRGDPSLYSGM